MEKDTTKTSGTAADLPAAGVIAGKEPELAAVDSDPQPTPLPQTESTAPSQTDSTAAIVADETDSTPYVPGNPSALEIGSDASDVSWLQRLWLYQLRTGLTLEIEYS